MKEVLVTGATGLVGSRFVELAQDQNLLTPTHTELNIADLKSVEQYLNQYQPDFIINFAAFTNVNEAEKQVDDESSPCWQINVLGVKNLLKTGIPLIQISTDMVFSGSADNPGPYPENHPLTDDPKKLTWYGFTKGVAEKEVLTANQTIVRIIYPVRAHFHKKLDYLRFPLSLFSANKLYPLFNDQQVSFTFTDELVEVLKIILKQELTGTYHVSSDTFTPYDLVSYAIKSLGGDPSSIKTTSVISYLETLPNPYRYPVLGGLDAQSSARELELSFKTWKQVVDELIAQGLHL